MKYKIDFNQDGFNGGFYSINGIRVENSDVILVNGTEIKANVDLVSKNLDNPYDEIWLSMTHDLNLCFEIEGIKCCILKEMYDKEIFELIKNNGGGN